MVTRPATKSEQETPVVTFESLAPFWERLMGEYLAYADVHGFEEIDTQETLSFESLA